MTAPQLPPMRGKPVLASHLQRERNCCFASCNDLKRVPRHFLHMRCGIPILAAAGGCEKTGTSVTATAHGVQANNRIE